MLAMKQECIKDVYHIRAEWHEDDKVWTALSDDIPGLVLEASTMEELIHEIKDIAPELLEYNCGNMAGIDIPISIHSFCSTKIQMDGHT